MFAYNKMKTYLDIYLVHETTKSVPYMMCELHRSLRQNAG